VQWTNQHPTGCLGVATNEKSSRAWDAIAVAALGTELQARGKLQCNVLGLANLDSLEVLGMQVQSRRWTTSTDTQSLIAQIVCDSRARTLAEHHIRYRDRDCRADELRWNAASSALLFLAGGNLALLISKSLMPCATGPLPDGAVRDVCRYRLGAEAGSRHLLSPPPGRQVSWK